MNSLHLCNIKTYEKYLLCSHESPEQLSYPLLVSPKCIEKTGKILYVGQETNTWGNQGNNELSVEQLEYLYDSFLKNGATNRPYWKFIKEMIHEPLYDSVVWTNLLLCGKRDSMGTPEVSEFLFQLSEEYLWNLYQISQPSSVIIMSSPNSVYKHLIKRFLEKLNCQITEIISSKQPVLIDEQKKVIWTYHPKFLALSKKTDLVQKSCKQYIIK